jgi:hypothetical protein
MSKLDIEFLRDFFSAYFHEDWMMESENPIEIVEIYCSTVSFEHRIKLANGIKNYADSFDESGNEIKLFEELGCYYDPKTDGLSKKEWLLSVANILFLFQKQ